MYIYIKRALKFRVWAVVTRGTRLICQPIVKCPFKDLDTQGDYVYDQARFCRGFNHKREDTSTRISTFGDFTKEISLWLAFAVDHGVLL